MIVERRAYRLPPDREQEFWAVQRDWYWPPEIDDFFGSLIGYFSTIDADPAEIVHLYRFNSLAHWETTYRALYQRFPPDYFTVVRKLLTAQRNDFMTPSPLDLPGVPPLGGPAGPPVGYPHYGGELPPGLVVQEVVTDFLPGGLFEHWEAVRSMAKASPIIGHNLIGMYHAMTGRLHRMYEYRWFDSRKQAENHRIDLDREMEASATMRERERMIAHISTTYLRPAPFAWLRPLFEPMDWDVFNRLDPALRRIAPWPPPISER